MRFFIYFILINSMSLISLMYARDDQSLPLPQSPWFTGPLIAPSGEVIPVGTASIQPYFSFLVRTGTYNEKWETEDRPNFYIFNPQFYCYVGLTNWMDVLFVLQSFTNSTFSEHDTHFGDLPVTLDFQLIQQQKHSWVPSLKFSITEVFPVGKYDELNPNKRLTDVSGLGTFETILTLVGYKLLSFSDHRFMTLTSSLAFSYFSPASVSGYSVYGTQEGAHATIYNGFAYEFIFSFEYSLNQNWVFSLDTVYIHENPLRSSGNLGLFDGEIPIKLKGHHSDQLSFAPGIEYNFSKNLGAISGFWVSAAGRNAPKFWSYIASIVYTF